MTYEASELRVLEGAVAARMRWSLRTVKAEYFPSTYVMAPKGIRDESAVVTVDRRTKDSILGCRVAAGIADKLSVSAVADIMAEQLRKHLSVYSG